MISEARCKEIEYVCQDWLRTITEGRADIYLQVHSGFWIFAACEPFMKVILINPYLGPDYKDNDIYRFIVGHEYAHILLIEAGLESKGHEAELLCDRISAYFLQHLVHSPATVAANLFDGISRHDGVPFNMVGPDHPSFNDRLLYLTGDLK